MAPADGVAVEAPADGVARRPVDGVVVSPADGVAMSPAGGVGGEATAGARGRRLRRGAFSMAGRAHGSMGTVGSCGGKDLVAARDKSRFIGGPQGRGSKTYPRPETRVDLLEGHKMSRVEQATGGRTDYT